MQEFLANVGLYSIFSITCIVIIKYYNWYRDKEIKTIHLDKIKEHDLALKKMANEP
jgi:hypothetical protein